MKLHKSIIYLFVLLSFVAIWSCNPNPEATALDAIPFRYDPRVDETILDLIALEQSGSIEQIDSFLNHRNPAYRFQALHSYCAPRYSDRLASVLPLLKDTVPEVRRRAIYAVGQSGKKEAIGYLQRTYNSWDSMNTYTTENALVLEAIGKCGSRTQLDQLASIQTFEPSDSVLIKGQVHGMFQLLLKGLSNESSIETMTKYFFSPQYPLSIRQIAGYYLMRGRELSLDKHEFAFGKILRSTDHFTLRANAAAVMANSGNSKYANILVEQLEREKNDQVKLNILRALFKMPYGRVKNKVYKQVNDKNPLISQMAARFFLINGEQDDASQYWDKVKNKKMDPITKAYFAAATAKNLPFYYALTRNAAIAKINAELKNSKDPYIKSQLLQVLAELPEQVNQVTRHYTPDAHPAIKSQIVFSVQKAAQIAAKNRKYINTVNVAARKLFNNICKDGDSGALAAMAYVLRDTASTNLHGIFRQQNDLKPWLDSIQLPREIETHNEIALLLNSYGDQSVKPVDANHFKAFDADLFKQISTRTKAKITTTRGDFSMTFFPNESPISATNFIALARQGYFNDKTFHRVVPNFVIQTGCPRGDGYGSQDYVIRSELASLHYDQPGKVGMASAGNDTESSQWFVTHLPVFHLDGRYTIFAQVESGMDVVNQIRVGDKINSIEITN